MRAAFQPECSPFYLYAVPVDPATTALLRQDFDLPQATLSEEELLEWLSLRVADLMHHRINYLMSLCYTLDLDEAAVARALDPAAPAAPHETIARLLYERQCARARSKAAYHGPQLDDADAW